MTNALTVTDAQIDALRTEAARAGDLMQVALCDRALGRTPSVFDDVIYGSAMSFRKERARAVCASVIAEAAAQES